MKGTGASCIAAMFAIIMMAAPLATVLPGVLADETIPPSAPVVDWNQVQDAVLQGLDWYAGIQSFDGGWKSSVGFTGLIVLCFANAGYDHTNRTVQNALGFMRNFYNSETGSLADSFQNYDTAISLMAMSAVSDPQDADRLVNMSAFLQRLQFNDDNPYYNMTQEWYQGGWPNHAGIPDASNSQFGLLGLRAADLYADQVTIPGTVWTDAISFMNNCQNSPDVNDLEWAHNTSLPSHDDGGFVYNGFRSRTPLGELMYESYGSMTAAGLFSYLVSGHGPENPEVTAAREWLEHEYNLEANPRMAATGLYYYLWSQARALSMSPNDWVVDGSGKLHDWRPEAADFFLGRQLPNGGWPGNPSIGWREEEPELAGIYALLTLQTGYLMAPGPELTIQVSGGDAVRFIDLEGRVMATDVTRGLTVTDDSLTCTDPETFRKVWVSVDGSDGDTAMVTATGTWGDDRTSRTSRAFVLGDTGSSALVATGGFTGPFGINIIAFDRGPVLELADPGPLELVRGETVVVDIDLIEASGHGPLTGIMLISHVGEGIVADVDEQSVNIPAGGTGQIGLTISVSEDIGTTHAWTMVLVSSTSPPVLIEVVVVEPDETWQPTTLYWSILGVMVSLVLIFFYLPSRAKPTIVDDDAMLEE
jgi:squalene-hopene/tetraprenyl-beta-curcumene cyclase